MIPGVESEEEARAVVELAKYAPLGRRGVCPMLRYEPLEDRYTLLNERLALLLQVEGESGVEAAAAIARVPGVDCVFVGVYDLSQSLGVPGQIEHPDVLDAGRRLSRDLPSDRALGVYVSSPSMARTWREAGATFLAYATDALLLLSGCREAARAVYA
jgi:4-hydroxy-2-oxoheptanedioate aldolase